MKQKASKTKSSETFLFSKNWLFRKNFWLLLHFFIQTDWFQIGWKNELKAKKISKWWVFWERKCFKRLCFWWSLFHAWPDLNLDIFKIYPIFSRVKYSKIDLWTPKEILVTVECPFKEKFLRDGRFYVMNYNTKQIIRGWNILKDMKLHVDDSDVDLDFVSVEDVIDQFLVVHKIQKFIINLKMFAKKMPSTFFQILNGVHINLWTILF